MAPAVVVDPPAFASICLHAIKHSHESVYGVLLGSYNDNKDVLTIKDAVGLSHGAPPTQPMVDIALGLLGKSSQESIVGWYTAPLLVNDTHAPPVALRLVAGLATAMDKQEEPTLIVVQNESLGELVGGTGEAADVLRSFGKDFGGTWLEPSKLTFSDSKSSQKCLQEALQQQTEVKDFVDHLQGDASSTWFPNKELASIVSKC